MEKKYYLVIFGVIIIIVAGLGLFINSNNHVNLGGTSFKTIDGYNHIQGDNFINFTKSNNFIYIEIVNGTINNSINQYLKSKNESMYNLSDFSLDGVKVYKVTLSNYAIAHFWFEKNHRVYEIYSWNYDEPTNLDILNLIKSSS